MTKTLIFIPTYNERENAAMIYSEIKDLRLGADFLFLDDNSPDGTGRILDEIAAQDPAVHVIHRPGKLGIGAAHQDGIRWAYDRGYETLVTMDCDFTHQPEEIRHFLDSAPGADVVIGSRYMGNKSLADWNLFRKFLTYLGHFLTRDLLKIPYDASGAFRLYDLKRIPPGVFRVVKSKSYSFFFESLHVLVLNGFRIKEVPILLPKRTYGHSKMKIRDAWSSFVLLLEVWLHTHFHREDYVYVEEIAETPMERKTSDEKAWDEYWHKKDSNTRFLYDLVAVFYRKFIIKPLLDSFIRSEFSRGAEVLHAGCGSGAVDIEVVKMVRVTALDISTGALNHYKRINGSGCRALHGSIFDIPEEACAFDGIYNLGVMEHFTEDDIAKILAEFHRVLKPGGKAVLFWPPEHGTSVMFLKGVHFILNDVLKKNVRLHPDEITRLRSKKHAERLLEKSGFALKKYSFGIRDFFTYAVVVAVRDEAKALSPGAPQRGVLV